MLQNVVKIRYILVVLLAVFALSCKVSQPGEKLKVNAEDERQMLERVLKDAPQFATMSAKCTISFANISSKAQIKMINGAFLQLSFQPFLGIEMVRIMVTKDSLYVIDRMNNLASIEPITSFRDIIPGSAGVAKLQNLLLGVPFLLSEELTVDDYSKFYWHKQENKLLMTTKENQSVKVSFLLNAEGLIESTNLYDGKGHDVASCNYYGHINDKEGRVAPSSVKMSLSFPLLHIPIVMEIKNISYEWDKNVTPNIEIPQRYDRVTLTELIYRYMR
ncbi:MAG: DUF4292 domain-containing protein [Bacteroidales bacterium]